MEQLRAVPPDKALELSVGISQLSENMIRPYIDKFLAEQVDEVLGMVEMPDSLLPLLLGKTS